MDIQRNIRVRRLVHSMNRHRKTQADKIDILCNDMVQAHRSIIEQLDHVSFMNCVHESLIGCSNVRNGLRCISKLFNCRFGDCCMAVLLLGDNDLKVCTADDASSKDGIFRLPHLFTVEDVRTICERNRTHLLPELASLPLPALSNVPPHTLVAAVPLRARNYNIGVFLVYSPSKASAPARIIHAACAAAPALAKALVARKYVTRAM